MCRQESTDCQLSLHHPSHRSGSALMWTQYFKLELLYVQKLKGRRMALGIEGQEEVEEEVRGGEEEENPVDVPLLEGEEKDEEEEDLRARSVRDVLAGAVPRVVYQSAIAARPRDLAMRLSCLETLALIQQQDGGFEVGGEERIGSDDELLSKGSVLAFYLVSHTYIHTRRLPKKCWLGLRRTWGWRMEHGQGHCIP